MQRLSFASVLLCGCYYLGEAGYVTEVPFDGAGGGSFTLRAGAGDLRDAPSFLGATGLESDLRFVAGDGFDRIGLGLALLYALQPGWDHDWTPVVRPRLHFPEVEWLGHGATFAMSPGVEVGAVFLRSRESNGRGVFTMAFGADYVVRGPDDPNAVFVGLTLGWGYSISLTIPG